MGIHKMSQIWESFSVTEGQKMSVCVGGLSLRERERENKELF